MLLLVLTKSSPTSPRDIVPPTQFPSEWPIPIYQSMSSFLYPPPSCSEDSASYRRRAGRPVSAKAVFTGSRRPSRPGSANRMVSMSHRTPSNSKLTSQSMLLNRMRPGTIEKDKEALFEDNLAVKVQLNEVRKENTRLKTKNLQLERELMRLLEAAEGKTRLSYMQNSSPLTKFKDLRKKVQALNQELISREEENDDMRRDILFTRKSELEAQVSAYSEECQRLRSHVSELVADRERLLRTEQLCEEQQSSLREMEKVNEDLRKSLGKLQKELQRTKRNSLKDRRKLTSTRMEMANLKAEITKLKGDFSAPLSAPKPRIRPETSPVPKSVQVTQAEIKQELGYEYSIPELLLRLGAFAGTQGVHSTTLIAQVAGKRREIGVAELFVGLRQRGFYWEREEARMLLEHIHNPGDCPIDELTAFLTKQSLKSPPKAANSPPKLATFPRIQLSEVRLVLRHIAYRLQLQRIAKSKLMSLIIGSNPDRFRSLQVPHLQSILSKSPFDVGNEEEAKRLARFLIETDSMDSALTEETVATMKKSVGDIVEKFGRSLETWEGHTPEEEEGFDQHIGAVLNRNKRTFKAACKGYDREQTEVIAYRDFEEVLTSLEFDFSEKEKHYLQLLFYSSLQVLDQVPYKELLKAYTEGGQSASQDSVEPTEAELQAMVQKYLQLIANALVTKQIPVRQAFPATQGLVSPQQFYEGYMGLHLPTINQQSLGLLVDALQGEEDREDYAIRLSFLEEVFTHYGVRGSLSTPAESQSSGDFGGKDDPLSEQSPFLTDAKKRNPPLTSDVKQWEVSGSEEQVYEEEDFESASARSV